MTVRTGDWVRASSPGIWRVVREIPEHYEPRFSLDAPLTLFDERLFVLKRLVDSKWKKALAMDSNHESFLKPLAKADARKLERFREDNPDFLAEFNAFDKSLDLLLNLPFGLAKKSDFRNFKKEVERAFAGPLVSGMTNDAILDIIANGSYATAYGQNPRSATLQFVCRDFEVKRRHFIYRQLNVHNF